MERFIGKVAVVTGSSSGIGEGICKELVNKGLIVVGLARRLEKLQEVSNEIQKSANNKLGKFHAMKCDISDENNVKETFSQIKSKIGPISILVNNAGAAVASNFKSMAGKDIDTIFDTNVKGLLLCTSEAINSMNESSNEGHIININSVGGHYPPPNADHMLYPASKRAARILSEGLRRTVSQQKLKIKVSDISPGLVRTQLVTSNKLFAHLLESGTAILEIQDIVNACITVLDTPPRVLIAELLVTPIH